MDNTRLMPLTANLTTLLKDLYKVCYLLEPHVVLANGKSVYSIKTAFKASCRCAKLQGFRFHDVPAHRCHEHADHRAQDTRSI